MTLVISLFAAIISTYIWYKNIDKNMNFLLLCNMFWGASLMWMIDAVFEYKELGSEFFNPAPKDMLNDIYLGLFVVAIGCLIWILSVLIKDPSGHLKSLLTNKK